ncbi:MAG TPA: response regulator [Puia sp.]|nr:response regulator [Puia sp.]
MKQEIDVLIVEDNPSDAEMTTRALKKNNFANRLFHVSDGAEALDFIFGEGEYAGEQIGHTLKLILLDLKMPRVNGIEVLQKIKADARTKKIPVVMLTSSKEDPDIQKCYDLGANGYVVKPVEFSEFHKTITNIGLFWLMVNEPPQ